MQCRSESKASLPKNSHMTSLLKQDTGNVQGAGAERPSEEACSTDSDAATGDCSVKHTEAAKYLLMAHERLIHG